MAHEDENLQDNFLQNLMENDDDDDDCNEFTVYDQRESRKLCVTCERPKKVCLCPFLPSPKIDVASNILILQHPNEVKRGIRTALIAQNSIAHNKCQIIRSRKYPGNFEARGKPLSDILESENTFILYPGNKATDLKDLSLDKLSSPTFIVLDGSWDEAKKLYTRNPILKKIKQVKLTVETKSRYIVRTQPADFCLSTLETVAHTLACVENRKDIVEALVKPLEALCNIQVNHGAVEHGSKEQKLQNNQFVKENNWKKKKKL